VRPALPLLLAALVGEVGPGIAAAADAPPYIDSRDLLEVIGLKKSRGEIEAYHLYPSIIPSIGYTPQNGVVVGITTLAGIHFGDPRTTTISNLGLVALYTSKNQVILQSRAVVLLAENRWQLHGDYRFLLTNQTTYGLGSSAAEGASGAAGVSGAQPMDFNLFRFHQVALRKVVGSFYLGAGYRLDRYYGIRDERLDAAADPPAVTSHEAYSRQFGFSSAAYTMSGPSAEVVYDTRDSTISAYRGWYLSGSLRAFPEALGSSQDATSVTGEIRTYVSLSGDVPRNVLGFWVLGSAVTTGRLPYLTLPSIGWDFANRTGRGYVQGRFRGDAELYAEMEWRVRLSKDGLFGGTVFASASTFARPAVNVPGYAQDAERLFSTVRPAAGVGLRVMMNREARNAVTLDLAAGQDSIAFYFGAGEAF
jgi:hypothetical protein